MKCARCQRDAPCVTPFGLHESGWIVVPDGWVCPECRSLKKTVFKVTTSPRTTALEIVNTAHWAVGMGNVIVGEVDARPVYKSKWPRWLCRLLGFRVVEWTVTVTYREKFTPGAPCS